MPIPSLAWVPVFILWFGLGNTVSILIVFYAALFPMMLNAWSGVRSVNQLWLRAAGAMGANEHAMFWKVILPGASPFIITGLRQAFLRAWIAVVGAEMLASSDWGLGWVIYDAKEFLNADVMLAVAGGDRLHRLRVRAAGVRLDRARHRAALGHGAGGEGVILDVVMPALVAGIHVLLRGTNLKTWMAGTSPAMTRRVPEETMKRGIVIACALAVVVCASAPAHAQDYPARQVTLVLPFAPGGAIDIFARSFAQKLSDKLGKPFVVENRPGAGTVVAAHSVARAAADGHTVLVSPSPLAINATLYKKLPYDTANDFMPVAYVADIPLVLVVHPSLPVQSIPDLIKYAKDNPGKLAYASSGTGTTLHLSGEMLKSMTGIQMTHVPYKGGPPALNDVVAGHVQLVFADPSSAIQQIKAGKVRPLGVTSRVRLPGAPEIPPIADAGVPNFEAVSWTVFMAPAKTPEPIAARLHAELTALAGTAEMREQAIKLGMLPVTSPSLAELRTVPAA